MKQLQEIRRQIAATLVHHTISADHAEGRLQLIEDTGLDRTIIDNALAHGVVESAELVLICQALDLIAEDVLHEAITQVCARLDLPIEDWPADEPIPYVVTKPAEDNA